MKGFITFLLVLLPIVIFSCSCGPPDFNFFNNIHKRHTFVFGVVVGYSDTVTIHQLPTQVWYVNVLDTMGNPNTEIGNIAVVTGQDGLNCGESSVNYSQNDTMVFALTDGFYGTFGRDSFYLCGCGTHYLSFSSGEPDHFTILKLKDKIRGIITGVSIIEEKDRIHVHPNPFQHNLYIKDRESLFGKIVLHTINGKEVIRFEGYLDRFSDLSLDFLPSGVYLLSIWTGHKKSRVTLVKQ
ncbi:MAG: T9SS type A sorting domain-containing protein [Saprospiraceae bacterium]|nr:T9SS type A sorting domain-containing protein [Saprospiraceae bacterium]